MDILEKKILNDKTIDTFRDKFMENNTRRSESIMSLAAFIISALTFVFVAFTIIIGWLSFKKYDEMKADLEAKIKERKEVSEKFSELKEEIQKFEYDINENKKLINQTKGFIGDFATELFSSAIISLLSALNQSNVITENMDRTLRNMIAESEYLLFLKHPHKEERQRAIYGLSGLGTEQAIPLLNFVVDDENEDPELRILAQQAINEIRKRVDNRDSSDV